LRQLHDDAQKQLTIERGDSRAFPQSPRSAFDIILDGGLAEAGEVEWAETQKSDRGSWIELSGLVAEQNVSRGTPGGHLRSEAGKRGTQ